VEGEEGGAPAPAQAQDNASGAGRGGGGKGEEEQEVCLEVGNEMFTVPEVLFAPNMVGMPQVCVCVCGGLSPKH
jgi:hypothetical protein